MLIILITFKIPCYKRISRSKLDPFFICVYGLMSNEPNGSSLIFFGSVKNVGVEDTPRISEPLSFFEKTLFSSAPTGVSHR